MMSSMGLCQLHSFEPLDAEFLASRLADRLDANWVDRRAVIEVVVGPIWRPIDLWPGGLIRPVWTAEINVEGPLWTPGAESEAASLASLGKRQAPVTLVELCADSLGAALVLAFSDATRSVYASVWRERRVAWSLRLDDSVISARCDGERVIVESPPRALPEVDRVGVLCAGLHRFLTEFPVLEGESRLLLPDILAGLTLGAARAQYSRDELFGSVGERAVAGK